MNVTSTSTIQNHQGRQVLTVGAIRIALKENGKLIPYATLGAGVISNVGDTPSVVLAGRNRFLFLPAASNEFDERDTVTLRYSVDDRAFVGVFGGGLNVYLSPRWGVRVDARAHLSGNTISNLVDANPEVATRTAGGVSLTFLTSPFLRFSNMATTTMPSNLTGPSISGFRTFSGSGTQTQVNVTAGLFWRF